MAAQINTAPGFTGAHSNYTRGDAVCKRLPLALCFGVMRARMFLNMHHDFSGDIDTGR